MRHTQDVDVLIRREALADAVAALEAEGFVHRHIAGMDVLLDGPSAKARDAVHLVIANEMVREGEALPNPDVVDATSMEGLRVLSLAALVRIKLTTFCDKDRVHLRDLLEVGLIDESWVSLMPPALGARLGQIMATPEG